MNEGPQVCIQWGTLPRGQGEIGSVGEEAKTLHISKHSTIYHLAYSKDCARHVNKIREQSHAS